MVRWSDGFFGGLIAGCLSALYFVIVGTLIVHDTSFTDFFAKIAGAIPMLNGKAGNLGAVSVLLGIAVHFLIAAIFGIVYAIIAARVKASWTAPTSVLCGITYGLLVYFMVYDVFVPVLWVSNSMPTWESILGTVLFFGLVLSEYITIAHRRHLAAGA